MRNAIDRICIAMFVLSVPVAVCWIYGRWVGMTLFGLPDPEGFDNVGAFVIGFGFVIIPAGIILGLYALGGVILKHMEEKSHQRYE